MIKSNGGVDPKDIITLSVRLNNNDDDDPKEQLGTMDVTFLYNADIVAAIKQVPPNQRSYNPTTKVWPVDLLALPDLLDHFKQLGFVAEEKLIDLCSCCQDMLQILYNNDDSCHDLLISKDETATDSKLSADATSGCVVVIDDDVRAPRSSQVPDFTGSNRIETASLEPPTKEDRLQTQLNKIMSILVEKKEEGGTNQKSLDKSDCGAAKKRRLTSSQAIWSLKRSGRNDSYDDAADAFLITRLASRSLSSAVGSSARGLRLRLPADS